MKIPVMKGADHMFEFYNFVYASYRDRPGILSSGHADRPGARFVEQRGLRAFQRFPPRCDLSQDALWPPRFL